GRGYRLRDFLCTSGGRPATSGALGGRAAMLVPFSGTASGAAVAGSGTTFGPTGGADGGGAPTAAGAFAPDDATFFDFSSAVWSAFDCFACRAGVRSAARLLPGAGWPVRRNGRDSGV